MLGDDLFQDAFVVHRSADPEAILADTLEAVAFIEKDSKRFADTNGWGYGAFGYDVASDTFKAAVEGHNCGAACHQAAKATDFIFCDYSKR